MIGAEHPVLVGEQFLVQTQSFASVAGLPLPVGDVVTGAQRVWVIGAERLVLVGEQFLEQAQSFAHVAALPGPAGDVVTGPQRAWVIRAKRLNAVEPTLPSCQILCGISESRNERLVTAL
jgi:hypothetical protein